jgi:type VI secretion system secreted protein VgrG
MGEYTQDNRIIQVYTPFDADVLLLESFHGHEGVSRLFNFELRMHSENKELPFEKIVGKTATIKFLMSDQKERYINGIVSAFSQGGSSPLQDGKTPSVFTTYSATLVPWLWVLTRSVDCRIFQNQTVPQILQSVFEKHKFRDFDFTNLKGQFKEREYCVQYRETDFNFVSRLMEEEGIFYYFEHDKDKHVLVLANKNTYFKQSAYHTDMTYNSSVGTESDGVIRDWSYSQEVRPGQYTVTDFNFMTPSFDLTSSVNGRDNERKLEVYDYPGEYSDKNQGDRLVALRIEEESSSMRITSGNSTYRGLAPGYYFDLQDYFRKKFNTRYVVLSVYHSVGQGMNFRSTPGTATVDFFYTNEFQCIEYSTPYRAPRVTPIPIVHGSQTAIVVGPANEEIWVDKYGRVKVQFHWDRVGEYKEDSSCWVRVSQNWAGKRWGAVFLPRIGQEVIVDFLEGDPDKPIITGCVYNGESMPPYTLPDHKTKSTIKTNSSKGGGGFNEIRFEDLKGREQIFFHAQRNQDTHINNDRIEWVGNESHLIVQKDLAEKIGADKHLHVGGDRNDQIGGTVSLIAGTDIFRRAGNRYALEAANEIHLRAGVNLVIECGANITLKVGGNFININPKGISIQGTQVMINSGGTATIGGGALPDPPRAPRLADNGDPGSKPQLPPKKTPVKPQQYNAGAVVLKQAAKNGTPFCEKCE